MSQAPDEKDQEKGDEVLRRLLKTPPDPKTGKEQKTMTTQSRKAGKDDGPRLDKDQT